jgi:hypothetical protein
MKRLLLSGFFLAAVSQTSRAQTDAFTRQVLCPMDPSIMGYTNVPDLNADMADELNRITVEGGDMPPGDYLLNLCPDDENEFDVTGGNRFRPVIDRVKIFCGGPDAVDAVCIVDGSQEQLIIEDSNAEGYSINFVEFQGITFNGFARGTSVTLAASAPAVATFINCVWQVRRHERLVKAGVSFPTIFS